MIDHMGFHHLSYLHLFSIVDLFSFIIIKKKKKKAFTGTTKSLVVTLIINHFFS